MRKQLVILATAALAFFISFAIAAYANSGSAFGTASNHVRLSPDIPALDLPPVVLSAAERLRLANLITSYGASKAGISVASFNQVRAVSAPDGQTMYVVPGSSGACLALGNSSTCGDVVGTHQIGLLHIDTTDGAVTGAGITDASVTTVTETINNTSAAIPVKNGVYVISRDTGLRVPLSTPLRPQVSVSLD